MSARCLLAALFAVISAVMPATAAADLYATLGRLEGQELKRAVSTISARGHRPLSYRDLWGVLKEGDRHLATVDHVVGVYSRRAIPAECTEGKAPLMAFTLAVTRR